MRAEATPLGELDDADRRAWRELAGRALDPNPYLDPDFVLPAARGLGEWDAVELLRVVDRDGWAFALPIRRYRRWHRVPLPCVATWFHSYCFLGTPLIAPGDPGKALAAALARLGGARRQAFVGLDWTAADGPAALDLDESDEPLRFDRFQRATLNRRDDGEYLSHVRGKHRREFRRLAAGLQERLGAGVELTDRAGEDAAIDEFLRLEAAGWKGRAGTALATIPPHAAFFRETCRALADRGALQMHFLEADGRAVAARCSLLAGRTSFCFKIAYDEKLAEFSPGRELELRLLDAFHRDERLDRMDSCAEPGNPLFNRLWPDRRALATLALPRAGIRGGLVRPVLTAARAIRNRKIARDQSG